MSTEKTPAQLRAEAIWRRRPTTPYDRATEKAWKGAKACVEATTEDEWKLLEFYYSIPNPYKGVTLYRRKDFPTHLNNWLGEIDKAKEVQAMFKARQQQATAAQQQRRAW